MASTPAAPAAIGPSLNFQPAFNRVAQSQDCDCAFACIAMIANKSLDEVKQAAVSKFKFPRHGLYWIGEDPPLASLAMISPVIRITFLPRA